MSDGFDFQFLKGKVARLLRGSGGEFSTAGSLKSPRLDSYGDLFVLPGMTPQQGAALAGSYFVATNPTPGTEIVTTTSQTAYDQDKPVALLANNGSSRIVLPDYMTLKIEQVPTSATRWFCVVALDTAGSAYVSGGSTLTSVCTHSAIGSESSATAYFGAITATDTTKRIISIGLIKDVVPVIDDQVTLRFGGTGSGSILYAGAGDRVIDLPPVALGLNGSMLVYLYGESNAAAPTYEVTMGWIER